MLIFRLDNLLINIIMWGVQQRIAKTQMIVVECLSLKPRQQTARYDQCLASYVTGIVG